MLEDVCVPLIRYVVIFFIFLMGEILSPARGVVVVHSHRPSVEGALWASDHPQCKAFQWKKEKGL